MCKKHYSSTNISKHYKICKGMQSEQLKDQVKNLEKKLQEKDRDLTLKDYQIEQLKLELKTVSQQIITNNTNTNTNCTTNNTTNVTNVNHYYVLGADGLRDGLDLTKLRTFGTENVDYVDRSKPLPTILKDIYCNEAHPENRVLSHEFLNLQWIMFRYQDHILRLHLEMDRSEFVVFRKLVCDNVERLLGRKYENYEETYDATRELLRTMDNEVRALITQMGNKKALAKLPIWNPEQVSGVEERVWKSYMREPNYSQNRVG